MNLLSIKEQIYGKQVSLNEIPNANHAHSLRVDSKGNFYSIDTTRRSTWKGRVISFIQWFVYGDKNKACDKAIGKALTQFERVLLNAAKTSHEITAEIMEQCTTVKSFTADPDFSKNKTLTQKINLVEKSAFTHILNDKEKNTPTENKVAICFFNNLATKYFTGDGVEKNVEKATELLQLAAGQGHATAQFNLGFCLQYGDPVNPKIDEALRLFQLAARQGYAPAEYKLGRCYEHGIGVEIDLDKAARFYDLAAEKEGKSAQLAQLARKEIEKKKVA